jgi:hypothetical protein
MKEYTWEILSLYTTPSVDGLSSVVKRVTWRYQVKEDTYVADVYNDTYFNSVDPNNFIDYNSLAPNIVFDWVRQVEDIDNIKLQLDEKLLDVKTPTIVEKEIPWDRSIGYTGTEQFVVTLDNTVILGPVNWNSGEFNKILNQHNVSDILPSDILAYKQGIVPKDTPLVIIENLKIYQVDKIINDTGFDNILFNGTDISWDYLTGKAVGTYVPTLNSLEHIKTTLKQNLRNKNSILEDTSINVNIDGTEFNISATSWGRLFIMTKILRLADGESCDWWNNKEKITVTKEQLMTMLIAVDDYINSLWDDEIPKITAIDVCTTVDQLKQIEI